MLTCHESQYKAAAASHGWFNQQLLHLKKSFYVLVQLICKSIHSLTDYILVFPKTIYNIHHILISYSGLKALKTIKTPRILNDF